MEGDSLITDNITQAAAAYVVDVVKLEHAVVLAAVLRLLVLLVHPLPTLALHQLRSHVMIEKYLN